MESKMYYVVMTAIGFSLVVLGWDSINAVGVYQLAILFGGAVLGHVLTEALNHDEGEDE